MIDYEAEIFKTALFHGFIIARQLDRTDVVRRLIDTRNVDCMTTDNIRVVIMRHAVFPPDRKYRPLFAKLRPVLAILQFVFYSQILFLGFFGLVQFFLQRVFDHALDYEVLNEEANEKINQREHQNDDSPIVIGR